MRITLVLVLLFVGCREKPEDDWAALKRSQVEELREAVTDLKGRAHKRDVETTRTMCKYYYDQAKMWQLVTKKLPNSLEDLEAPIHEGGDDFVAVSDDLWGNKYVLTRDGRSFRVTSRGPDGQEGTDDDIAYPLGNSD